MIINAAGLVKDCFSVSGPRAYPIYLLDGHSPVIFDGGITCAFHLYADAIRSVLGGKQPEIVFISHVHWDHCGAVSYLKSVFPSMRVAMSPQAGAIMKRRNAVLQMQRFNAEVRSAIPAFPDVDVARLTDTPFQPFNADIELKDGEITRLGPNLSVVALSTPGHTRDNMSYYIPEKKILVTAEACGCLQADGSLQVAFLADYDLYLASLKRLAELPVEILCQGHLFVFVGRHEVQAFLDRSIEATIYFRNRVYELLEAEGSSVESVVMQIKAEQYDTNTGIKQPEAPYLINLRAEVAHLAEKAGHA